MAAAFPSDAAVRALQVPPERLADLEPLVRGYCPGWRLMVVTVVFAKIAGPSGAGTAPASGTHGRLRWENDCKEIHLGGVLYDLEKRRKARYCIRYLVGELAYDEDSARHLETQIDPYVRENARMPALPEASRVNLRIQHYFTGTGKNLHQLCTELIKSAGNGRFFLHTK